MKVGNQGPRDPLEGRQCRASRSTGRIDGRYLEITNCHTKTPADCSTGRPRARSRVHDTRPPDQCRLPTGGVSPDEQGKRPGVDGVTAQAYAEHLDESLRDLHDRLRRERYQAPLVERVWLEKDDGGHRPIGQPTFEDKIVQRAVAMLLEAIYEQDFHDCSYGFRQGRRPHDALHELRERCMTEGIGWIVDADVSGYFDSIDKTRLQEVL
jgi:Reverse transcriptase (RNA-dependent DNA polymerase)